MAGTKNSREGYGGTSEQRQRGISGDSFSERAPHTAEEVDSTRSHPEDGHQVVRVQVTALPKNDEPDGT
jgi:hypothetical protein